MRSALTLPHGLLNEVMLGLQFGDQVPAFEKLLQFLQKRNAFSYKSPTKFFRDSEPGEEHRRS